MQTLNVQFTDATEQTIKSYFGAPQNPGAWPNLGTVGSNDARWATYFNALPVNVQPYLPAPTSS